MINESKNEKREIMVSHQSDLLTQDLILTGVFKYCKFKEYDLSFDFPYIKYEHGSGNITYPVWQVEELKELNLSKEQLTKLTDFLEGELSKYRSFLKRFKKNIKSPINKEKKVKEFFEESLKAVTTIPYFAFEMGLYKNLEKDGISPKDIPTTLTDTTLASLELEKIAQKNKKELNKIIISKKLKRDLKKFCDRFGYLGMIYFKGDPWTIPEAYRMLSSFKTKKQEQEKSSKISIYMDFASILLKLRTQKWETMCYGTYLFRKYIEKYFSNEIHYNELLNLRINEVLDLIDGKYPSEDKSQGRDYFILEIKEPGVFLSTEKKVLSENKEQISEKEIKGVVAYPGKISGYAKIVITPKQSYKVENGDILVTKMSTPDFLPAMKKASAFVADIGGITSHIAIVSREMKKPCIIGTKIATEILKDGDYIEVDANKGIVRKIKK